VFKPHIIPFALITPHVHETVLLHKGTFLRSTHVQESVHTLDTS